MKPERLRAYLQATRLTDLPGPLDSQLAGTYHEWHENLTAQLRERFEGVQRAKLFVTYTAEARSELLTGVGERVIVHDQHLGRTLHRMTAFVVRRWPVELVHSWALERLGTAFFARGKLQDAEIAAAVAVALREQASPPSRESRLDGARALMVTIQEFFVLAHEVAHTVLGPQTHEQLARRLHGEIEETFANRRAADGVPDPALAERVGQDLAHAIERNAGRPPTAAELEQIRLWASADGSEHDDLAWLDAHRYVYEEVACDLIATELCVDYFARFSAGVDTVLPAILMALHHMASLEWIEARAQGVTDRLHETTAATMLRKSVWRHIVRRMYDESATTPLGPLHTNVSEDHATHLGDQVLFIVPVVFGRAREKLLDVLPPGDATELRPLLWGFTSADQIVLRSPPEESARRSNVV